MESFQVRDNREKVRAPRVQATVTGRHPTLGSWFSERVQAAPDAIAVRAGSTSLTCRELDEMSNRWAHQLLAAGAGPGDVVAVAVPRDERLIGALLAVVKSGAAYLPLDVSHPADRLTYLLDDATPTAVLSTTEAVGALPRRAPDAATVLLDGVEAQSWPAAPVTDAVRRTPLRPDHAAYVIYTSGSTGRPKGVTVSHRNVLELLVHAQPLFGFDDTDVWTMFHSCVFDFSVWEMWGALLYGGRLVLVDFPTSRSPDEFRELVIREGVTVVNQTPSAFYQFAEADRLAVRSGAAGALSLRHVILGGEALDPSRLREWFARHGDDAPRVTNMYGITETTVHVTSQAVAAAQRGSSLVGDALPGMSVYVLDDRLRPVAREDCGEIYVAGPQVSQGYRGRPALTAGRFLADPFGPPGTVMYRSGDLARWDEQGQLEYLGRVDDQVELRGFRIELGEVESQLRRCAGVADAVAAVGTDERLGDRLIGYVVPRPDTHLEPAQVRSAASAFLPDYMLPDVVVIVGELPLTANGKLDRNALAQPRATSSRAYRPPRTATEGVVADVYAEVLGVEPVGADDNFFELGGNSLLAARVVSALRESTGVETTVRWILATPTVAGLASRIDAERSRPGGTAVAIQSSGLEILFPLRAGSGPGLFLVHPLLGLAWSYAGLAVALDFGGPVYGLQTPALSEDGELPNSIDEIAQRYLAVVRSVQPSGPYRLLGWSLGGVIAHCMATWLQSEGEDVAALVLLDSLLESDLTYFYEGVVGAFAALGVTLTEEESITGMTTENAEKIAAAVTESFGPVTAEQVRRVFTMAIRSPDHVNGYRPVAFRGDVLYLVASAEHTAPEDVVSKWEPLVTGEIHTRMVDCSHNDMMTDDAIEVIAPIVSQWLRDDRGAGRRTRVDEVSEY